MKKKLPNLRSDKEAEDFVDTADLSEYDLSVMKPYRFEFAAKDARLNMRLPNDLFLAIKDAAADIGIPYQRYVRQILENTLHSNHRH